MMGKTHQHIVAILLAALLLADFAQAKKLKSKKNKLGKKGHPHMKVKKMVESLRQSGRDETEPDEHGNSLKVVRRGKGGKEMMVEQRFRGVTIFASRIRDEEIEGGRIEVKDGKHEGAPTIFIDVEPQTLQTGEFYEGLELDFPTVNKGKLIGLTSRMKRRRRMESVGMKFKVEKIEAEPTLYIDRETNEGTLGIYVTLSTHNEEVQSNPTSIYNERGEKIANWDDYQTAYEKIGGGPGGNPNTGIYVYGSSKDHFTVDRIGLDCYLRTEHLFTYHHIEAYNDTKKTAHKFPCQIQFGDEANGGYSPLNDVHANAEKTLNMFMALYGTVPFEHLPLQLRAHHGNSYAGYDAYTHVYSFGNGPSHKTYPLTTLGVVAHELGHGVTEFGAHPLKGTEGTQWGGLIEAFSDMTAMAALYHNHEPVTWRIMDNVFKPTANKTHERCVNEPKCDHAFGGRSIDHVSQWRAGMNSHNSCGVFNRVFYLIAQNYTVWDAYDLMYAANTVTWTTTSNFVNAAAGVLRALDLLKSGCIDYGWSYSNIQHSEIVDAFREVGIDCRRYGDVEGWACGEMM